MSLFTRALVVVLCGGAGFLAAYAMSPAPPAASPSVAVAALQTTATASIAPPASSSGGEGALMREWEQLRAAHGEEASQFPALYQAVKEIKDPFRRRAFRAALIAEWAMRDPAAGIAFLQQKDSGNVKQLLREWLRIDPQAAIDGCLAGDDKRRGALRSILDDIARVAPARLAQVVAALPKTTDRWDTSTRNAFTILALHDPEAARAAAEALPEAHRAQALAGVATSWAQADGAGALAWAQTLPEGEARDAVLKAVLTGWAQSNPLAALEKLDLAPPGGEEMGFASDLGAQVLREAGQRDWDGTLRWLQEHPGKLGQQSLQGLMGALSARLAADPAGAMQSLAQSNLPGLSQVLGNAVLNEGYAQHDAIWKWLDEQPESDFALATRSSLINAAAWKEPEKALRLLENLPDTPANKTLIQQGMSGLLNGGSQMSRFEELLAKASPALRGPLLEAGFQYSLRDGTGNPARWVARFAELPAERRPQAASALAQGWANSDPHAAVTWALSLQDPAQQTQALRAAAQTWALADTYEAAEWVNSLPSGVDRDVGAGGLVQALSMSAPESAWTWALSITQPEQRQNALALAYMGLRTKDPAIAEQLLQSGNLPAAEARALRDAAAINGKNGPGVIRSYGF